MVLTENAMLHTATRHPRRMLYGDLLCDRRHLDRQKKNLHKDVAKTNLVSCNIKPTDFAANWSRWHTIDHHISANLKVAQCYKNQHFKRTALRCLFGIVYNHRRPVYTLLQIPDPIMNWRTQGKPIKAEKKKKDALFELQFASDVPIWITKMVSFKLYHFWFYFYRNCF